MFPIPRSSLLSSLADPRFGLKASVLIPVAPQSLNQPRFPTYFQTRPKPVYVPIRETLPPVGVTDYVLMKYPVRLIRLAKTLSMAGDGGGRGLRGGGTKE